MQPTAPFPPPPLTQARWHVNHLKSNNSMMKHTLTPAAALVDRKRRDLKNMREHKRKCKKRARQGSRSRV